MASTPTAVDIVLHELVRRIRTRPGLHVSAPPVELKILVTEVLAIADDLKAELARASPVMRWTVVAGGPPCPMCGFKITRKEPEPFRFDDRDVVESRVHIVGADLTDEQIMELERCWNETTGGYLMDAVMACSHRAECPHLAKCIGADRCTEPAISVPAYLPLGKEGGGT